MYPNPSTPCPLSTLPLYYTFLNQQSCLLLLLKVHTHENIFIISVELLVHMRFLFFFCSTLRFVIIPRCSKIRHVKLLLPGLRFLTALELLECFLAYLAQNFSPFLCRGWLCCGKHKFLRRKNTDLSLGMRGMLYLPLK